MTIEQLKPLLVFYYENDKYRFYKAFESKESILGIIDFAPNELSPGGSCPYTVGEEVHFDFANQFTGNVIIQSVSSDKLSCEFVSKGPFNIAARLDNLPS